MDYEKEFKKEIKDMGAEGLRYLYDYLSMDRTKQKVRIQIAQEDIESLDFKLKELEKKLGVVRDENEPIHKFLARHKRFKEQSAKKDFKVGG